MISGFISLHCTSSLNSRFIQQNAFWNLLIFFLAAITKFTPDIPLTSLLLMCFSHICKLQLSPSSSSGQRPSYSPSFISHTWVYMKEQVLYFDLHRITRLQLLFTVLDFCFWFWWNSLYPSYLPQRMTRTPGWNSRKSIWRHLRVVSASRTCLTKSSENRLFWGKCKILCYHSSYWLIRKLHNANIKAAKQGAGR